jgi:hypothetical protein
MTSGLSLTLSSDLGRLDDSNEFLIKASNGACSNSQQLTLRPDEFQDFANPAAINNPGKLLREWNGRNKEKLEWLPDQ